MRKIFIFSLGLLLLLSYGCKRSTEEASRERVRTKQEELRVESIELAEAILGPKSFQASLPRDPFNPTFGQSFFPIQQDQDLEFIQKSEGDINLLGILKMEDGSITLLEFPPGEMILGREGDSVGEYTIKRIDLDKVILEGKTGSKILDLKGGEE